MENQRELEICKKQAELIWQVVRAHLKKWKIKVSLNAKKQAGVSSGK
jgi:hypothetical protein